MTTAAEETSAFVPCDCRTCITACKQVPGWLHPDDVEPMAKHFDVSVAELFRTKLVVNWWLADEGAVFVLSPAKITDTPGDMSTANPRGRCSLLSTDDRCSAHPAHPLGCRAYLHTMGTAEVRQINLDIVDAWKERQPLVEELLGEEPHAIDWQPWGLW